MKEKIKKPKSERKPRTPAVPIIEPALPLLLCAVSFSVCLVTLIIDRFIYPIGGELLAPVILQLLALLIPAYLSLMLTMQDKPLKEQMSAVGFSPLRAEYVFFVIFASLFAICASLTLTLMTGGAYDAERGITLLGVFTAGENEYTVSLPYLILTYALIPALTEEFFFRGVLFSGLKKISFPFAALISTVAYSLFGFTLGGLIPSLLIGALSILVLYTTGSLWFCIILHFLYNLYRLFLEANIAAYFLSSQNNILLLITAALALALTSLLFFSESATIYRTRAEKIAKNELKSARKAEGISAIPENIRSALAYRPTLIFTVICICVFAATVTINYFVA